MNDDLKKRGVETEPDTRETATTKPGTITTTVNAISRTAAGACAVPTENEGERYKDHPIMTFEEFGKLSRTAPIEPQGFTSVDYIGYLKRVGVPNENAIFVDSIQNRDIQVTSCGRIEAVGVLGVSKTKEAKIDGPEDVEDYRLQIAVRKNLLKGHETADPSLIVKQSVNLNLNPKTDPLAREKAKIVHQKMVEYFREGGGIEIDDLTTKTNEILTNIS